MGTYSGTYPPSEGLSRTGDKMNPGADLLAGNANVTDPMGFISLQQCQAIAAGGVTPATTITFWDASKTYLPGNIVIYSNSIWTALATSTNSPPTLINTNWSCVAGIGYLKVTGGTLTGNLKLPTVANTVLISDSTSTVSSSSVSTTTLGYLDATSSIQTQLNNKLNLTGGTLTGSLTLAADPTANLEAATKRYVDNNSSTALATTNLTNAIIATDTSFLVNDTYGFPNQGKIKIDSEIMSFNGISSTGFISVTRGIDNTTAAPHALNAKVTLVSVDFKKVLTQLTGDGFTSSITYGVGVLQITNVGGSTASDISTATQTVQAATTQPIPNTLVLRDSTGLIGASQVVSNSITTATAATTSNQVPNLGQVQSLISSAVGGAIPPFYTTVNATIPTTARTIIAETSTNDITLTLPTIASFVPSGGNLILPLRIIKLGTSYKLIVNLSSGDIFSDRSTSITLYTDSETSDISALVFKNNVWVKN